MLLNSQVFGEGAPLLILHGLFGSASNWRSIGKRLASHPDLLPHQVHLLDMRNHGQSFWSEQMSYPVMAEDVSHYIDHHGLSSPSVLGHSMGGKAAMILALTQPGRVHSLMVADIAPVAYQHDHSDLMRAMQSLPLAHIRSRSEADRALEAHINERPVRQFLLQNLQFSGDTPQWRLNLDALQQNMSALFDFPNIKAQQYSGASLIIRGQHSDYVTADHQAKLDRLLPKHKIETIPQAGHWLHAEQPKLFMQVVTQFLSQNPHSA